ncbi:hypothetical protein BH09PLA1_BH09PLA1_21350 [soil metagenome]
MKTTNLRNRLSTLALATTALLGTIQIASAVPINGQYLEDPRCDTLPNQALRDELGQASVFPINEAIQVNTQAATFTVCVPNDGLANDWIVEIRNVSGQAWRDLFFVVDSGATVGNADGRIRDATLAPNVFTDAMRIDGTVTAGVNNNLLFESGIVNEIFEPGEIWRFNVSNFNNNAAFNAPPIINSPGIFAGSSPLGTTNGNSSILANPVPEPATVSVILGAAAALLLRRPGRNR